MSTYAVTFAYEQELPKSEKFVLVTIGDFASPCGVCFPGWKRLSAMCSCDEATIVRIMKKLETTGFIARVERRRPGGSRASDWIVMGPGRSAEDRKPMRAPSETEQLPDAVMALIDSPDILQGDSPCTSTGGSPDISDEGLLAKSGGLNVSSEPPEEPPNGTTTPVSPQRGQIEFRTGQPRREGFERRARDRAPVESAMLPVDDAAAAEWAEVTARLAELDGDTFNLWLADARPVGSAEVLLIAVDEKKASWVRARFSRILAETAGRPVRIVNPDGSEPAQPEPFEPAPSPSSRRRRRVA